MLNLTTIICHQLEPQEQEVDQDCKHQKVLVEVDLPEQMCHFNHQEQDLAKDQPQFDLVQLQEGQVHPQLLHNQAVHRLKLYRMKMSTTAMEAISGGKKSQNLKFKSLFTNKKLKVQYQMSIRNKGNNNSSLSKF